ncbi:hypothetical protein, variant [Saprolegnia diclina VS20]|uniref:Uncharacterized protein n=1 Tax=Saprolegnia diclina (strain VS20) TaxID=1156394 RepID=T0RVG9_SAPDV|nr:hypothetical protein, variant [Saprolegnia diclina VS20]EQC34447.1 hypothetical protein, variant [Saprolegnia diclina VS20]|eukprot:XP_008612309.1 hypothetical protein, variant [Saprolegnia diclina VS20]
MLLFHLVFNDIDDAPQQPFDTTSALAALLLEASKAHQDATLHAFVLQNQDMPVRFATLSAADKLRMQRLAEADCVDMALVTAIPRRCPDKARDRFLTMCLHLLDAGVSDDNDDDDDEEEEGEEDREAEEEANELGKDDADLQHHLEAFGTLPHAHYILSPVVHPSCALPAQLKHALRHKPLWDLRPHLHHTSTIADDDPVRCLVVWPRQHRVRLLGFRTSLAQLKALVAGTSRDLYGYASIPAFAAAVLDMVGSDVDEPSLLCDVPDVLRLSSVLVALGDVALIRNVLAVIEMEKMHAPLRDVVVTMLRHFGWTTLQSAIQDLVQRTPTRLLELSHAAAFLVGCLELEQPYLRKMIVAAYWTLLEMLDGLSAFRTNPSIASALLQDLLRLEGYLRAPRTAASHRMYLDTRLPPGVVDHIALFLRPCALVDVVTTHHFAPMTVVASALYALRDTHVVSVQSYRARVDRAVDGALWPPVDKSKDHNPNRNRNVTTDMTAVLALALLRGSETFEALLDRCLAVCTPTNVVDSIYGLVTQCPGAVPPGATKALAACVLEAASSGIRSATTSTIAVDTATTAWQTLQALDAITQADAIVDAVDYCVAALASDHTRPQYATRIVSKWCPVVAETHELPRLRRLLALLQPTLEASVAAQRRPSPNMTKWAIPSTYFYCDCALCSAAEAFVHDPSRGVFTVPGNGCSCIHFFARLQRTKPFRDLEDVRDHDDLVRALALVRDVVDGDDPAPKRLRCA